MAERPAVARPREGGDPGLPTVTDRLALDSRLRGNARSSWHFSPTFIRLIWHDAAAADVDPVGLQRAVRLLHRADDRDVRARLELAALADHVLLDLQVLRDHDLLLAVLVFHHHHLAVHRADRSVDRGVGHGAAGLH